jgi:hypothetical protein
MAPVKILPLLLAAASSTSSVNALTIQIPQFNGTHKESWESFEAHDGSTPPLPNATSIFDGLATITYPGEFYVINPNIVDFSWGSTDTHASVVDGFNGLGINSDRFAGAVTIDFNSPITRFGGYWAAGFGADFNGIISFEFSDGTGATVSYSSLSGVPEWHGWEFEHEITSLSFAGDFVFLDGLQAKALTVPDAGTSTRALLVLAGLFISAFQRKFCSGN